MGKINDLTLLLNKSISDPSKTIQSWNQSKSDPNNTGQLMHDEAVASDPHIIKPGSENILHTDSLTKMMRGNVSQDAALQTKLNLEKNGMLSSVIKESYDISYDISHSNLHNIVENMGGAAPIAPMNSTPYPSTSVSKKNKKSLSFQITDAYNKVRRKK